MKQLPATALWERRDDEGAKAFAAFVAYLELGETRSLSKVANRISKSCALIRRWSRRHRWMERVRAWEAHIETLRQSEAERRTKLGAVDWALRAESIRHREFDMAEALLAKAGEMLQKLPKATLGDAVRAIELGFKLQRLACGLPTEHTEHSGGIAVSDVSTLVINIPSNGRAPASQITDAKPSEAPQLIAPPQSERPEQK